MIELLVIVVGSLMGGGTESPGLTLALGGHVQGLKGNPHTSQASEEISGMMLVA